MSWHQRFWIGGGGGLLPLLITLIGADLAILIDQPEQLTNGVIIGAGIRYFALFILGGVVAAVNSDEVKPLKLLQLGVAAPALITSYINVGPVGGDTNLSFDVPAIVGSAYAAEAAEKNSRQHEIVVAGSFFSDVYKGLSKPLDRTVKPARKPASPTPPRKPETVAKPVGTGTPALSPRKVDIPRATARESTTRRAARISTKSTSEQATPTSRRTVRRPNAVSAAPVERAHESSGAARKVESSKPIARPTTLASRQKFEALERKKKNLILSQRRLAQEIGKIEAAQRLLVNKR